MSNIDSHEENVNGARRPSLDEDALIAALEDDNSASFIAFREQRIQQLHNEYNDNKKLLSEGFGNYLEINEEKELLELVPNFQNIVVHFAKDDFARCRVMDTHLNKLAKMHLRARFFKIYVEKAPFLVKKMKVRVLPCVLCWKDGYNVDRIVGFEGLGISEDAFNTIDLEARLITSGIIEKSKHLNVGLIRKTAHKSENETSDESS